MARVCVERFGFDGIRLTGGEPTVRAHLPVLVEKLAALGHRPGAHHQRRHPAARWPRDLRAGRAAPRQHLAATPCGPSASSPSPAATPSTRCSTASTPPSTPASRPVKVNCVLIRGVNDDEIVDFAAFGRERGVTMRFIEFMPLDADDGWSRRPRWCPAPRSWPPSTPSTRSSRSPVRGSAPAERFRYRDGARRDRRHRQRHPAVLRELRPGPPHRRRAVPQLPVRRQGDRPALGPAVGGLRRRPGRRHRAPTSAPSGPATPSARSTSSAPTAP